MRAILRPIFSIEVVPNVEVLQIISFFANSIEFFQKWLSGGSQACCFNNGGTWAAYRLEKNVIF